MSWTTRRVLRNLFCRIISVKKFHAVTACSADQGKLIFFSHSNCFGRRGSLACQNRNPGADCFDRHICRNASAGINHTFFQINIMAQGISDGFVQSIVASDIFTLEEQFSITCKKTAVGRPGLAVEWSAVCKTVCQVKDLLLFPGDRSYWH